MNLAQIIQSHALSFFHLSAPDLLLGMDSDPARRNLFGLAAAEPEFARGGIRLRQFGQEIIERLGGKKIHPTWTIPGGVRSPLKHGDADAIRGWLPEVFQTITTALDRFKLLLDHFQEEAATFGSFPSLFLSLVTPSGSWEHYDGVLRVVDAEGNVIADRLDPTRFEEFLAEEPESSSYLKSPHWRERGCSEGMYRVGPLARLNVCDNFGTSRADAELSEYRSRAGRIVLSSFFYHYARLIEILAAIERIEIALDDSDLFSDRVRSEAGINRLEGIGVGEAPRGTLFHHYHVDEHGVIQRVNLLIATGQNNLAMNRTIAQIARHYVREPKISEGILNRIEAGIRAFDPCLSCSTHAIGQMALCVQLFDSSGALVDEVRRM
jgi:NAD-reducing hydrogenase large subunit